MPSVRQGGTNELAGCVVLVFAAVTDGIGDAGEVTSGIVIEMGDGAGTVYMLDKLAVFVPAQVFVAAACIGDADNLAVPVVLVVGMLL